MDFRLAALLVFAGLALAGCGGGMQLGGPGPDATSETLSGDDPQDGGAINEGVGSVIQ